MTIVYREVKGSALTYSELDGNFADLAARTDLAWSQIGAEPTVRDGNPNSPTLSNFRDGLYEYVYLHDELNEAYLNFDVPYDYAVGTDLCIGVHWSPGSSTSTGTVRFGFEFTYAWSGAPGANTTFGPSQTIYVNCTQATATAVCVPDAPVAVVPVPKVARERLVIALVLARAGVACAAEVPLFRAV